MKKILIATLAFALTATAAWADVTYVAGTGIVGSVHDMNMVTDYTFTTDTQERVCAYCHTPHHADVDSYDYMPLWSREISGEATFTAYDSTTLHAETTDLGGRDGFMFGPSILCMSCHDGVVAPDAYYGSAGTDGYATTDDYGDIGVGLGGIMRNDHPIGFDYTAVQKGAADSSGNVVGDSEIRPADETLVGNYGITKISEVLWGDAGLGTAGAKYFTCASCHDVHNGPSVVENYLLYGPQKDSEFCRMCHLK